MPKFYEFFAGGGMARLGLGEEWTPLAANDFNPKKQAAYIANWGGDEFIPGCISTLTPADLPGKADLAWASFPCQDLSLAGKRRGIYADRSGAFWPFWQLMLELNEAGRIPPLIALENVTGMLTANRGKDFADICEAMIDAGFKVGAAVIDAQAFVPQSRKRVFVIAIRNDLQLPDSIVRETPDSKWHPDSMIRAVSQIRKGWIWLTLPTPPPRSISLAELIEPKPSDVAWHDPDQTRQLLEMMSDRNRQKIDAAIQSKSKT
ncbi:MAG: DNA cytosine methyltransferase, partial [Verrucomicrobiota bacterium]